MKQAKADYAEGKISEEEKDRIIDAAITDVVKKQKELGSRLSAKPNDENNCSIGDDVGDRA